MKRKEYEELNTKIDNLYHSTYRTRLYIGSFMFILFGFSISSNETLTKDVRLGGAIFLVLGIIGFYLSNDHAKNKTYGFKIGEFK